MRQHHDLAKLLNIKSHQFDHRLRDRIGLVGNQLVSIRFQCNQSSGMGFLRHPFTPFFRDLLIGLTGDLVTRPRQLKLKNHFGERLRGRIIAAHLVAGALTACGFAIQGVANRIQNRAFSCTGCPIDQKQWSITQLRKVNLFSSGKRAESLEDKF
ncbi:Uncharacterised protein [Vibrio cholerae]|nr:Uncharacterised protein [Vibrio cholerae]